MKPWQLTKRVDDLSEKLDVPSGDKIARFDFSCFTPEEQYLFEKIFALKEQYGDELPENRVDTNIDLILKTQEILVHYTLDTFKFVLFEVLGGGDELEKWYINLHLNNFLYDLSDCIKHVQKWPKDERAEFLAILKETGMINKIFRFPKDKSLTEKEEK